MGGAVARRVAGLTTSHSAGQQTVNCSPCALMCDLGSRRTGNTEVFV